MLGLVEVQCKEEQPAPQEACPVPSVPSPPQAPRAPAKPPVQDLSMTCEDNQVPSPRLVSSSPQGHCFSPVSDSPTHLVLTSPEFNDVQPVPLGQVSSPTVGASPPPDAQAPSPRSSPSLLQGHSFPIDCGFPGPTAPLTSSPCQAPHDFTVTVPPALVSSSSSSNSPASVYQPDLEPWASLLTTGARDAHAVPATPVSSSSSSCSISPTVLCAPVRDPPCLSPRSARLTLPDCPDTPGVAPSRSPPQGAIPTLNRERYIHQGPCSC